MTTFDSEYEKLFGLGGTFASGKDTLASAMANEGFVFVSTSDWLRKYAEEYGYDLSRKGLQEFGNHIRRERGPGGLVEMAVDEYEKVKQERIGEVAIGLVVSSIRTPGEVETLKRLGGMLVYVDGDIERRYERMKDRIDRGDELPTFEEFKAREEFEWHQSDDPGEFSMKTVYQQADVILENNYDNELQFKNSALFYLDLE